MQVYAFILVTTYVLTFGTSVLIDGDVLSRMKAGEKVMDILRLPEELVRSVSSKNVKVRDDVPSTGAIVIPMTPSSPFEVAMRYGVCIDNEAGNSQLMDYVSTSDDLYPGVTTQIFNLTYYSDVGCPGSAFEKSEDYYVASSYNVSDSCYQSGQGTTTTDPSYFMASDGWNTETGQVTYNYYTKDGCADEPANYFEAVLYMPFECNCQNMTFAYNSEFDSLVFTQYTDETCSDAVHYYGSPDASYCVLSQPSDDDYDDDFEGDDDVVASFFENADTPYVSNFLQYSSSKSGGGNDDGDDGVSQASFNAALAMVFVGLIMGIGCGYLYFKRTSGDKLPMANQRY